jgi:hypothetical protein
MIPSKCEMPDLSELDARLVRFLILDVLIGEPGLSQREGFYRRNFVRLVDKALLEYQDARSALIKQIEEGNAEVLSTGAASFFRFIRHLENCVNATSRLLKLADRIKSEKGSLSLPRLARRSIEAHSRTIPDIRNAIEHMDEIIRKDEIAEGQPVMLGIGREGDRVVIASHKVRFSDLSNTLRSLHDVACHILEIESTLSNGDMRSSTA